MKCSSCGNELNGDEKYCGFCGAPVGEAGTAPGQGDMHAGMASAGAAAGQGDMYAGMVSEEGNMQAGTAADMISGGEPVPGPKKKMGIVIGVTAAAVVAVGAAAFGLMSHKDPKEVVIAAFENIYTENQTDPMEELFGISGFAEKIAAADMETSVTMILDSCSEISVSEYAGSGIRVQGREDRTNDASFASIGVIYKDMDLANLNVYYGDETVMMALPELSDKVFTMDLSDGLAERIQNSPFVGAVIQDEGLDLEGLAEYAKDLRAKTKAGEQNPLDLDALWTRFKEGTQAQEKFKEALVVEQGEKGTYVMDGEEVSCDGYQVMVSKDSMMEFMRSSTDFFLNDQELKDQYLEWLEQMVKLTEVLGGSFDITASQLYLESMEDITDSVNEMIEFLDESLTDVTMEVYVDKKGRLAAVKGSTALNADVSGVTETIDVAFDIRLEGGAYLTQNLLADIVLERDEERMKCSVTKRGTYDGNRLTSDMDLALEDGNYLDAGIVWTGTYDGESGDYHMNLSLTENKSMILDLSMTGVVDQLEKGTSIHTDIDELKVSSMAPVVQVTLRGEYSLEPLAEAVTPLEGETFDILASDENQWQSVIMEFYMNAMKLMNQLSM